MFWYSSIKEIPNIAIVLKTLTLSCWSFCCWFPNLLVATDKLYAARSQQWSFPSLEPSSPVSQIQIPIFHDELLGTTATGIPLLSCIPMSRAHQDQGLLCLRGREQRVSLLPYKCGKCEGDFQSFLIQPDCRWSIRSLFVSSPSSVVLPLADVQIVVKMSRDDTLKEKKKGKRSQDKRH